VATKWKDERDRARAEARRAASDLRLRDEQLALELSRGRPAREAEVRGTISELRDASKEVYEAETVRYKLELKDFHRKWRGRHRGIGEPGPRRMDIVYYTGPTYNGPDGHVHLLGRGRLGVNSEQHELQEAARRYVEEAIPPNVCKNWEEFAALTLRALAERLIWISDWYGSRS
jgi:hypothetical protein